MRSKNPEALNQTSRITVYGSHSRPIILETNLITGEMKAFEQTFAPPPDYEPPTNYDPDNPPVLPERSIPVATALDRLGLRKEKPVIETSSPLLQPAQRRLTLVRKAS